MLNIFRDFEDGAEITALGYQIIVRRVYAGQLAMPTGQLVACDPLIAPESEPFEQRLPPGDYAVWLVMAELRDETLFAYAVLELSEEPAARWQLGQVIGESAEDVESDAVFQVSSDVACFMDLQTADAYLHHREQAIFEEERDEITNELQAQLARSRKRGPGTANVSVDDAGNIVAFEAGRGKGYYSTYFGHSHSGELRRVVIDFRVLDYRFPSFGFGPRS